MNRFGFCASLTIITIAACGGNSTDTLGGGGSGGEGGGLQLCAEHPLDCPAGETCWFADGGTFACLTSGAGKEGDVCSPLVGQPTCGDTLLCVKKVGADEGTCAKLCDPSVGALCGEMLCVPIEVESGEQTHACL